MSETIQMNEYEENRELREMMSYIPGGVHCCKDDGFFTMQHMSDSFLELLGYTRQEVGHIFQNRFLFMIHPDDREPVLHAITNQLSNEDIIELEYRLLHKNGTVLWVLDKARKVTTKDGRLFYCMLVDITKRKYEQEDLRLSLERHQIIMDQTQDIIFEWDILHDKLILSNNWNKKFGYTAVKESASIQSLHSPNVHPEDLVLIKQMQDQLREGIPYLETEIRIKKEHDSFVWCRIRATTQLSHNGTPVKAVGVILDIQDEKENEQRLVTMAETDALTGLYNKKATEAKIEQYLHHSTSDVKHALLIIDLDNFKLVNDCYGHLCGDVVIATAARHIQDTFTDKDIIGRIGGDEFMIFTPMIDNADSIHTKAAEIAASIRQISTEEGTRFFLTCSIGIAFYPDSAKTFVDLYQCADQALYQTKANGRNGYVCYKKNEQKHSFPPKKSYRARTAIESEEFADIDQTLAQYFFRLLYLSLDVKSVINHTLEFVGRSYAVSRVYIFENSRDNRFCSNTFEWCNKGISPEIKNLQNLSYETDLTGLYDCFNEQGVFCCPDIKKLPANLYECLRAQGITSVLQCAILDDGEFNGYIGFDQCDTCRDWTKAQINSLKLIANVLSTFLLKLRYKEHLQILTAVHSENQ